MFLFVIVVSKISRRRAANACEQIYFKNVYIQVSKQAQKHHESAVL